MIGSRRPRPRLRLGPTWAAIFAEDLLKGGDDLVAVFGPDQLARGLPISIPIDGDGVVLLQPAGPVDAPRVPATLVVSRPLTEAYGIRIERVDGGPLVIPGFGDQRQALVCNVNRRGIDIVPAPPELTEDTARALATALLITIQMKLVKAQRS